MRLNDRPTSYFLGLPTYHDIAKVPPYLASKTEWVRRGYAVCDGEHDSGTVCFWNVRSYLFYDLFHISQCREISGEKARVRRANWRYSDAANFKDGE